LKNRLSSFQDQIDSLENDLNTVAVHGNETIIRQRLSEIFALGLYAMNRYNSRQEKINSTLINPGHTLSPELIDPDLLLNELTSIRLKLPNDLILPFAEANSNLFKFYHFMSVSLINRGKTTSDFNKPFGLLPSN
jgi:hypothetical protein